MLCVLFEHDVIANTDVVNLRNHKYKVLIFRLQLKLIYVFSVNTLCLS